MMSDNKWKNKQRCPMLKKNTPQNIHVRTLVFLGKINIICLLNINQYSIFAFFWFCSVILCLFYLSANFTSDKVINWEENMPFNLGHGTKLL